MRFGRVHAGDLLAAVAGVLLLLSMQLDWFVEHTFSGAASEPQFALNAWETFDFGDLILAAVAAAGIAMLVVAVVLPAAATAMSAVTALAGAAGVISVMVRVVAQPGANEMVDIAGGAWLGLLCAIGVFLGGWMAMRAERGGEAERGVSGAPAA
jgi:hypothetical protein